MLASSFSWHSHIWKKIQYGRHPKKKKKEKKRNGIMNGNFLFLGNFRAVESDSGVIFMIRGQGQSSRSSKIGKWVF